MVFTWVALFLMLSTSAFASKTLTSGHANLLYFRDCFALENFCNIIVLSYVLARTGSTWKYGDSDGTHGGKSRTKFISVQLGTESFRPQLIQNC